MEKRIIWCLAILSLGVVGACSTDDNAYTSDMPQSPGEMVTDLGEEELANCYIVTAPGDYKFAADNQFNLGEGLPVPPKISPVAASLVWQTVQGSISEVELIEDNGRPFVKFVVTNAHGNALLAVLNDKNEIEWSWHIWMPDEDVYAVTLDSGYEVMIMNLGASCNSPGDSGSYGMLYQWGRKDPFPASSTLTGDANTVSAPLYDIEGNPVKIENSPWNSLSSNNIAYSISHPTVCLSNYAQYSSSRDWLEASQSDDSLWGNPLGDQRDSDTNTYLESGRKTCYDPSPAGWRVPPCDAFRHFTSSGGYAWDYNDFNIYDYNLDGEVNINDYNYGWHFLAASDSPLYFPAASRYDGSYAMLMGSMSGL